MPQGPLFKDDYRPHFSGHETFPLRYGWLKKAFDHVNSWNNDEDTKAIFIGEDAISRFGVGKNMVASIRHWAMAVNVIAEDDSLGKIIPGDIGNIIFNGAQALDPYLENPNTLWLIHWRLASQSNKTTWFWVFNQFNNELFDRSHITEGLEKLAESRQWARTSSATVKRDVECFVRSYVAKPTSNKTSAEDSLESPLAELGLIKPVGKRDGFRFVRGSKPSLGNGVFLYALIDFWNKSHYSRLNHLTFDAIAHAPGSPGRIFLLDENALADRLVNIESYSDGVLTWSETSGIKQIIKRPNNNFINNILDYIRCDYEGGLI